MDCRVKPGNDNLQEIPNDFIALEFFPICVSTWFPAALQCLRLDP
jgi:hypothetical protein